LVDRNVRQKSQGKPSNDCRERDEDTPNVPVLVNDGSNTAHAAIYRFSADHKIALCPESDLDDEYNANEPGKLELPG
jgi:hypothetical protein